MTIAKRRIDVTIQLASGSFDGGGNTVTLKGLRVLAELTGAGGASLTNLNCRIYGLPLAMMNQLTVVGLINTTNRGNTITLQAGNEGGTLTTVFKGDIYQAWADFQGAPASVLNITALPAYDAKLQPVEPTVFNGTCDVANVIMPKLAKNAGLVFQNYGVNVQLADQTLEGTAVNQIDTLARAADINYSIDKGVLSIWPKNGAVAGEIPLISPKTGMVGYPIYNGNGIVVTSEFLADIGIGRAIQVQSSLTPACGTWLVAGIIHELESEIPNGAWFTQMTCYAKQ